MHLAIRNNKFINFICCVLGMYFLNISVDATDILYYEKIENLSINNQESIIEIIIEKVFGFDNAIAEQDDNDNSQNSIFKKIKTLDFTIENESSISFFSSLISNPKEIKKIQFQHIPNPLLEIISPPPKV